MKYLKMLGVAAVAAMAMMAFAASASATTLEVNGVTQNKSVTLSGSLKSGSSAVLRQTSSDFVDTCTTSTVNGKTEGAFTGATVGGKATVTFSNCTHTTTVHTGGTLSVEHIAGTTNGTVRSSNAQVTVQSTTFGATLNCTTNNTHLGTLTYGTHATLNVNAVVNCGFFVPSAKWEANYVVTSPTTLGVSA